MRYMPRSEDGKWHDTDAPVDDLCDTPETRALSFLLSATMKAYFCRRYHPSRDLMLNLNGAQVVASSFWI